MQLVPPFPTTGLERGERRDESDMSAETPATVLGVMRFTERIGLNNVLFYVPNIYMSILQDKRLSSSNLSLLSDAFTTSQAEDTNRPKDRHE